MCGVVWLGKPMTAVIESHEIIKFKQEMSQCIVRPSDGLCLERASFTCSSFLCCSVGRVFRFSVALVNSRLQGPRNPDFKKFECDPNTWAVRAMLQLLSRRSLKAGHQESRFCLFCCPSPALCFWHSFYNKKHQATFFMLQHNAACSCTIAAPA